MRAGEGEGKVKVSSSYTMAASREEGEWLGCI